MAIKRSWIVVALLVTAVAVLGQRQFGTHHAPKGQPALVHLDTHSLEILRGAFNAAQNSVRLIVLLSPT
jgi:hypothetical protein